LKEAWHKDKHEFDCEHPNESPSVVDVVFCMDTTGSMGSYIKKAKDTVKKII